MIEENVKLHDKYSLEIKLGYRATHPKANEFAVHMWFYIPHSLDINKYNYPKLSFYRDLKSNLRLITPVYTLAELANKDSLPSRNLHNALQQSGKAPEYHVRMFASIVKSALRSELKRLTSSRVQPADPGVDEFINDVRAISGIYRAERDKKWSVQTSEQQDGRSEQEIDPYALGDEFLSNTIEQHTFRLMEILQRKGRLGEADAEKLMKLAKDEIAYKKTMGYPTVESGSKKHNRELVLRLGLLKKYIESELFLDIDKQREGVLAEQVYFSVAAGIAMLFATAVAFFFQKQYGELTMPFFIVLIVSYIMKDRIKDLTRYYMANRWGRRFFDVRTNISLNDVKIGWQKEGMDFVNERKVPAAVRKKRKRSAIVEAENRIYAEKIILYRKLIRFYRDVPEKISPYPVEGMNSIIRFNVANFLQKMDNPVFPLYIPGKGNKAAIEHGEKIYYINLVLRYNYYRGEPRYRHIRIALNRSGITEVTKVK